mmetsp:Transcript_53084/g.116471  ORF Transcript_53084/g.116471 Transcript_53084/m.116471 type:complete len:226 (+) Transcript_53084:327-1004(+)
MQLRLRDHTQESPSPSQQPRHCETPGQLLSAFLFLATFPLLLRLDFLLFLFVGWRFLWSSFFLGLLLCHLLGFLLCLAFLLGLFFLLLFYGRFFVPLSCCRLRVCISLTFVSLWLNLTLFALFFRLGFRFLARCLDLFGILRRCIFILRRLVCLLALLLRLPLFPFHTAVAVFRLSALTIGRRCLVLVLLDLGILIMLQCVHLCIQRSLSLCDWLACQRIHNVPS